MEHKTSLVCSVEHTNGTNRYDLSIVTVFDHPDDFCLLGFVIDIFTVSVMDVNIN